MCSWDGGISLLLPHGEGDVVGDGPVDSVQAEAAQQQQPLEGRQALPVLRGERRLLRPLQVIPLRGSEDNHARMTPSRAAARNCDVHFRVELEQ